jgi:hypothetical protein
MELDKVDVKVHMKQKDQKNQRQSKKIKSGKSSPVD